MYLLLLDEATSEFDEEEEDDDDDMGTHVAPLECVIIVLLVVGFITVDVSIGGAPQFQKSPEGEEETIRSLGICLLIDVDTTEHDDEHPLPPASSTSFQRIGFGSKPALLVALYFNILGGMITETFNVY